MGSAVIWSSTDFSLGPKITLDIWGHLSCEGVPIGDPKNGLPAEFQYGGASRGLFGAVVKRASFSHSSFKFRFVEWRGDRWWEMEGES
jgi:hypothetical protein